MPVPNVPLFQKTLDFITAHPEEHDQTEWVKKSACGTTACFAGHAVQLAGHEIDWTQEVELWNGRDWTTDAVGFCKVTTGQRIKRVATEELGITEAQAGFLFDQHASVGDLWRMAHEITSGEIEVPEEFL